MRERLRGKACLVVLDDVWELAHAKPFDVVEGASKLLVTTRDRSILTALGARDIRIDALTPAYARELLAGGPGSQFASCRAPQATLPKRWAIFR